MLSESLIEIFSTEVSVSGGSENFENSIIDSKERNIKGSTTEIENEDVLLPTLLVKSVSDSSGRWFVDDSKNIKAGNGTGILCCLSLRVVEISRHCDNCVLYFSSKVAFSDVLHLLEDHS